MHISVIGCGYLGTVHATCMAMLGHTVIGIDVDSAKIDSLMLGKVPFYEPDLDELYGEVAATERLTFSTEFATTGPATMHFVCVGTPQLVDGMSADLQYVNAAIDGLIPYLNDGDVIVGKSTVPAGTAEAIAARLATLPVHVTLLWNPEFLREGHAVQDTLHPDRVVYGAGSDSEQAMDKLDEVYASMRESGTPFARTDLATAQLVKLAANAFLATKISFINAVADVCQSAGGNITELADCIGMDDRIGRRFLNAGLGFGGGCLPKDIRVLRAHGAELGVSESLKFFEEVEAINIRRRQSVVKLAAEMLDGLLGKNIAVLGAAFTPLTDDVRDSPALAVAMLLHEAGANVRVTDPKAVEAARRMHPELDYCEDIAAAALEADLVILATEWPEFIRLSPDVLGQTVRNKQLIDARNVLDSGQWAQHGWKVRSLGMPSGRIG